MPLNVSTALVRAEPFFAESVRLEPVTVVCVAVLAALTPPPSAESVVDPAVVTIRPVDRKEMSPLVAVTDTDLAVPPA